MSEARAQQCRPTPGAFGVVCRNRIDHGALHPAARAGTQDAAPRTGGLAHFGRGAGVAPLRRSAHSRLPSRARAGSRHDLAAVRGREREGRLARGAQGDSLASRRERRRSGAGALPAGIRDRPARAARQHRAPVRARRRGRSRLPGNGILSRRAICAGACARACRRRRRWDLPRRSPVRWARCTRRASCIATSSPAT